MLIRKVLLLLLCCSLIQGAENSSAPTLKQRLRKYLPTIAIAGGVGVIAFVIFWNKRPVNNYSEVAARSTQFWKDFEHMKADQIRNRRWIRRQQDHTHP